jgi:diguanylate cyclase (GGDEF)-like protein
MDYGTLFIANIASVTVFALCVGILAWHNRNVTGMKWFAGAISVGLVKLILQGLEGRVPTILCNMAANELYLVSSVLQFMGLHWFVVRKPIRHRWPFFAIGVAIAAYTATFLARVQYSANFINIPNVLVCSVSAWILLKHGRATVSRTAAAIVGAQALLMAYRAVLTNLIYARPWETVHAESDPRWLYSLAILAFLASCMVMCDLWFLVTELGKELAAQAHTDPLTGALNRRAIEEAALRETARSIRHGHSLCMLELDIDHFKNLNDTRGHAAGDCVLRALVCRLKTLLRVNDLLARTGGEEFTILLPDTAAETGMVAAERVRQSVEDLEVVFEKETIKITVSVGVAQLDPSQDGWEGMMRQADAAMYRAKEKGRNLSCFFTEEMNRRATERLVLENSLRLAIDREELFLQYQPQVNIASGRVIGLEALVRWQHPELGLVMPDKFIQVAESSGLIVSIGEWVLRTACSQIRKWQDEGFPVVPVAVNVSAVQFRHKDFRELVKRVLFETEIAPHYIELELTESLLLSNADMTFDVLQDLKEMGVKLVIDDFGTGYSSLSYLRHFPVTKIKIDRSFIRDIELNSDAAAITTTIISMAKSLNLKVIAEGVENEAQLTFLREHGCGEFQGFYFSRPLDVKNVASLLRLPPMCAPPRFLRQYSLHAT